MLNRSRLLGLLLVVSAVLLLMAVGVALANGLPPGGTFTDDNGNIHEPSIEAIAAEGITKGCNPPANTLYCPSSPVTRGQMAAFLTRALGLPATATDFFTDDDGTTFEADINRLAAAGITKGCNPPTNDLYCPDGKVTRGQMAAFLVRAFGYTDNGGGDLFIDDDGSVFEADIDRLGTAGVTKGCNPPTNDRYCPDSPVLRDQMASFLTRALNLTPIVPPPTTTTTSSTSTTTTTTTIPAVIDEGSGTGDDVVMLSLPNVPVVIELHHDGSSNFYVWSLDNAFGKIDLLVNEIGSYSGTRAMQFADDEPVSALEIGADGNWSYQIRRLSAEPLRSCPVNGSGDSVALMRGFKNVGGVASLSHSGSSNFYIWAWSSSSRDLLVNEIGSYSGTVAVTGGYYMWEIGADGSWSVNC